MSTPSTRTTSYVGIKETNPPQLYFRDRAPFNTDFKGYDAGDIWLDQLGNEAYIFIKKFGQNAVWVGMTGGTATAIGTLTGNSGGAVGPDDFQNLSFVGTGSVAVAGDPGTHTLTISGGSGGGFTWNQIISGSSTMAASNAYVTNFPVRVDMQLPATSSFGDAYIIAGKGTGGWGISQQAGQTIHFGNLDTTIGVGGYLQSTNQYDTVSLVCITPNTDYLVLTSIGNITIF